MEAEAKLLAQLLALLQSKQALTVVRDAEIEEAGRVKTWPWLVHVYSESDPGFVHTGPELLSALEHAHARVIAGPGRGGST